MFERFRKPSTDIQVGDLCVVLPLPGVTPKYRNAFCEVLQTLTYLKKQQLSDGSEITGWYVGVDIEFDPHEVIWAQPRHLKKVPPHGIDFSKLRSRPKPVEVEA